MQVAEKLVRKQFLISPAQIKKTELLERKENTSSAKMVRNATTAYNPDVPTDFGNPMTKPSNWGK